MDRRTVELPGRKVALEVKRALKQAVRSAMLNEQNIRMQWSSEVQGWGVFGGAALDGWPHGMAPLRFQMLVWARGEMGPLEVFCNVSDEHPAEAITGGVLSLLPIRCSLADLPTVLHEVWTERQQIMKLLKAGQQFGQDYRGRWAWRWRCLEAEVMKAYRGFR